MSDDPSVVQDYVCPECGELVRIAKGQIVKDCRCGLPGNETENKRRE